jgi:thymidylate synthase ThyX
MMRKDHFTANKVKVVSVSQPLKEAFLTVPDDQLTPEFPVLYCARVSNPKNQLSGTTKLLNYCLKHGHVSIFEQVVATVEITTSRAIARQILRHRSACFQEFCLAYNTLVKAYDINDKAGITLPIGELYTRISAGEDLLIKTFDHKTSTCRYSEIADIKDTGIKEVLEVKTKKGYTIRSTEDHKFWSGDDYVPLSGLKVGSSICVMSKSYRVIEDTIVSITFIGEENTYDLSAFPDNNYIAGTSYGFLVHNSGRYAEYTDDAPIISEARLQDPINRQSSTPTEDQELIEGFAADQELLYQTSMGMYRNYLNKGVAKEQARVFLPEGMIETRMYMTANLRTWLHYINLRSGSGTQAEHSDVAIKIAKELVKYYPNSFNAAKTLWGWDFV